MLGTLDMSSKLLGSHELLSSEELGLLLGIGTPTKPGSASKSINAMISRGVALPPSIRLPGLRGRRWRKSVVLAWLIEYERTTLTSNVPRGRPRKIDQIAQKKVADHLARE